MPHGRWTSWEYEVLGTLPRKEAELLWTVSLNSALFALLRRWWACPMFLLLVVSIGSVWLAAQQLGLGVAGRVAAEVFVHFAFLHPLVRRMPVLIRPFVRTQLFSYIQKPDLDPDLLAAIHAKLTTERR